LNESGYMTGPKISVVDIMVYCEIDTICLMYNRDVPANLAKLANWYERLAREESL